MSGKRRRSFSDVNIDVLQAEMSRRAGPSAELGDLLEGVGKVVAPPGAVGGESAPAAGSVTGDAAEAVPADAPGGEEEAPAGAKAPAPARRRSRKDEAWQRLVVNVSAGELKRLMEMAWERSKGTKLPRVTELVREALERYSFPADGWRVELPKGDQQLAVRLRTSQMERVKGVVFQRFKNDTPRRLNNAARVVREAIHAVLFAA